MRNWHGNRSPFGKWHTAGGVIDPFASLMSTLLSGASQLIAHPLEYGSMFQDRAGTTPVTSPGQLVGMVLDHGFTGSAPVLGPELVTNVADQGGPRNVNSTLVSEDATSIQVSSAASGTYGVTFPSVTGVVGSTYKISMTLTSNVLRLFTVVVGGAARNIVLPAGLPTDYVGFNGPMSAASVLDIFASAPSLGETLSIDNISVRELPGYHATSISDAARGVYAVVPETGRRNLLEYTEEFGNAAWDKSSSSISGDLLIPSTSDTYHFIQQKVVAVSGLGAFYTVEANPAGYNFLRVFREIVNIGFDIDLANGTFLNKNAEWLDPVITTLSNGWVRIEAEYIGSRAQNGFSIQPMPSALNAATFTGDGVSGVRLRKPQVEFDAFTTYQKVVSEFDVTEEGVPSLSYISYNGVNTAYSTPALPAPLVDKAQVFAGARKLSDAAATMLAELGPLASSNNGSFYLTPTNSAGFGTINFLSRGTSLVQAFQSGNNAPLTSVITGLGDISGDSATLRIDGTQVAQSTADQGTGNYNPSGTYPLYYGARGGTSLFFNGRHYDTLGPITRLSAANATTEQIEAAEAYYTARVI